MLPDPVRSVIVTTEPTPDRPPVALVWYGGSTFHVHAIDEDGVIAPEAATAFTSYGDAGNAPTPAEALGHMLAVAAGPPDHPAWQ